MNLLGKFLGVFLVGIFVGNIMAIQLIPDSSRVSAGDLATLQSETISSYLEVTEKTVDLLIKTGNEDIAHNLVRNGMLTLLGKSGFACLNFREKIVVREPSLIQLLCSDLENGR